jgi:hypothetical protein
MEVNLCENRKKRGTKEIIRKKKRLDLSVGWDHGH